MEAAGLYTGGREVYYKHVGANDPLSLDPHYVYEKGNYCDGNTFCFFTRRENRVCYFAPALWVWDTPFSEKRLAPP